SLHDALPISLGWRSRHGSRQVPCGTCPGPSIGVHSRRECTYDTVQLPVSGRSVSCCDNLTASGTSASFEIVDVLGVEHLLDEMCKAAVVLQDGVLGHDFHGAFPRLGDHIPVRQQ